MFPIIDVTDWTRLGTEQMGTKPKFWCLDQSEERFLFKESRSHAGEHWSEKVAAVIAGTLGLPHAEIELAVCGEKNGTLSKTFLPGDEKYSLIHGNELLSEHDPSYPAEAPNFRLAQHTLDRIFSAFTRTGVVPPSGHALPPNVITASDLFVGYLMLDALIVNTDRHHANWALIASPNTDGTRLMELAPTFDHASSLGRELTDERRRAKLMAEQKRSDPRKPSRRDQTVVGYLEKEEGRSRIFGSPDDTKALHPLEVFERASQSHPQAAAAWLDRLAEVETSVFASVISEVPPALMTSPSRDFCLCVLDFTRTALISRTFHYA